MQTKFVSQFRNVSISVSFGIGIKTVVCDATIFDDDADVASKYHHHRPWMFENFVKTNPKIYDPRKKGRVVVVATTTTTLIILSGARCIVVVVECGFVSALVGVLIHPGVYQEQQQQQLLDRYWPLVVVV
jgi:hypothetical protein